MCPHPHLPSGAVSIVIGIHVPAVRYSIRDSIVCPCMIGEVRGFCALRVTAEWAYQLSRFEHYLRLPFPHGENSFERAFPRVFVYP